MFNGTRRFRVIELLGRGGMGAVYRVHDEELGREVALKTLLEPGGQDLREEFRKLAGIIHPNLVELYELIATERDCFFTMELVEGRDLDEYVRGTRAAATTIELPSSGAIAMDATAPAPASFQVPSQAFRRDDAPSRAVGPALGDEALARLEEALGDVVVGLSTLHANGIVHLDIKPSNIRVSDAGRVVILDFGLATQLDPKEQYYRPYVMQGTLGYMAPEQLFGRKPSHAADWYAVGVLLYELLTGRLPFDPRSPMALFGPNRKAPPSPRELVPSTPAALSEVAMALLETDPSRRAGGDAILAAIRSGERRAAEVRLIWSAETRAFVGRAAEVEVLRAAFLQADAGAVALARIEGPSGMGKTELIRHFLGQLGSVALVLQGRCRPQESVPFNAFDDLLDGMSRHLAGLPPGEASRLVPRHLAALRLLCPAIDRVEAFAAASLPAVRPEDLDPQAVRRQGFEALRRLLQGLTAMRPLILWIDDAQWGDADSGLLLKELLRAPAVPPFLLILSYRGEDLGRSALLGALEEAARELPEGTSRTLSIGPLTEDDARELVVALLGAAGEEALGSVGEIAAEAAGSPFFLGSLAKDLVAQLDVPVGSVPHPARVADVVRRRVDGLSAGARRILELVSIAGGPLDRGLLLEAAGTGESGRLDVGRLSQLHLLRSTEINGRPAVEAYHDRIREAVAVQLAPDVRRDRHLALVEALLRRPAPDPEALVRHYVAAGDRAAAGRYALAAADRASAAFAFDRAARFYRQALELGSDDAPRWVLHQRLAQALTGAGRGAEAAQSFVTAASLLAEESPADLRLTDLRRQAAEQHLRSGHTREGIEGMRAVLAGVGVTMPSSPPRAAVAMLRHRARFLLRGTDFTPRRRDDVPPAALARLDALWGAATSLSMLNHSVADALGVQHLVEALELGERSRVGRALGLEASFESGLGGAFFRSRSAEMLVLVRRLAEQSGDAYDLGWAAMAEGTSAWLAADWARAAQRCDHAAAIYRERCRGVAWEIATNEVYALSALAHLGRIKELWGRVSRSLRDAEDRGDLFAANNLRLGQPSVVWLAADRVDESFALAEKAEASWTTDAFHTQRYHHVIATTQAALYAGDGGAALVRMTDAWPRLRSALFLLLEVPRAELRHLKGRAALAAASSLAGSSSRRFPSRARGFDRGDLIGMALSEARWLARDAVPIARPFAALLRAGAAQLGGDRDGAIRELTSAVGDLDRAGMELYREAARYRLGALAGDAGGRAQIRASLGWMEAEGIRRPEAMIGMLTPGCDAR